LQQTSRQAVAARLNNPTGLLALLSAAHAVTHAFGGLMPLIFPIVANEFHMTYTDIGFVVGFTTFAGGMMQLVYSFLGRYMLRKVIVATGQLVVGLSCLLTGMANGVQVLFLGNLGARLGASPQHPVGNSLLSDRFPASERGSALSLHVVGGNIGTVLVPILGAFLLSTVGWRATLFVLAVPAFILSVALVAFIEEHKNEPDAAHRQAAPTRHLLKQVLTSRTIFFITVASGIGAAGRGLGAFNTYLPLYLGRNLSYSTNAINAVYACLLIGGVIGPFVLGKLSDRAGRRPVLYLIYGAASILTMIFIGAGAAIPLLMGGILLVHGLFSYSDSVILTTFLADVATPAQRDVAFSVFFTVAFGVGSLWPTLLGYIADHYGLPATFAALAVTYVLAALWLIPISNSKTEQVITSP
jgi:MFS transporter, FSR family, fosmidomycin resistance protein